MAELSPPSVSAAGSRPQKTTGGKALVKKAPKKKPAAKPHGVPTGGDRLAAWLANPGLRSKLPDSALTPDLLKTRQTNQYNASPAAPGSSYTNKDLSSLVAMLSRQKFGPAELALQQQGQALNQRQNTEIPAWFQSYRDTIGQAKQAEQAAAAAQVTSLQNMATSAAGDTGMPAGANDPEAAARATAAAGIRSAGISNQAATAQNLGGIQNAYLGNLGLNSFGLQQGALQNVGAQRNELGGKLAQLASDKGDFGVTQRQTILGDEADAALKAALTSSQVTENKAQATATTKNATTNATKAKTAATTAKQKTNSYGYTNAEWSKMTTSQRQQAMLTYDKKHKNATTTPTAPSTTDKDPYGNTRKQRQAADDSWTKAQRLASRAIKAKPDLKKDPGKLIDFLISENVNSTYAQAAVQAATHDGRLGPKTKKRLEQRGITKFPKASPRLSTKTQQVVDQGIADVNSVIQNIPGVG